MNRIEFMTELAALLQDIPAIERQDAMKYYNDYFDDAGEENEQEVIREFGSPVKLAEVIKADMNGAEGEKTYSEYRETGYTDTRYEDKEMPAGRNGQGTQQAQETEVQKPRTSPLLKVLLIIAIIFVGAPVIIPVGVTIIALAVAIIACIFAFFVGIVCLFVALAVTGVVLVIAGLITIVPEVAIGLALIGTGLILGVIGVIGTVGSVKLCIVAVPGICRGIVTVFNRLFRRRKAVA